MTIVFRILLFCLISGSSHPQRPARTESATEGERWRNIHRQEESRWAKKEHLSVTAVQSILWGAGLESNGDFYVENIDAHTLLSRGQVLLSTWESGTGKCLAVHILQREGSSFREIWSAARAGQDNFCSPGVCGGANAHATLQDVIVQVPLNCDDLLGNGDPAGEVEIRCVRFSWKGNGYALAESKEKLIPVARYKREPRHCSP
jgi:hypothetical protein